MNAGSATGPRSVDSDTLKTLREVDEGIRPPLTGTGSGWRRKVLRVVLDVWETPNASQLSVELSVRWAVTLGRGINAQSSVMTAAHVNDIRDALKSLGPERGRNLLEALEALAPDPQFPASRAATEGWVRLLGAVADELFEWRQPPTAHRFAVLAGQLGKHLVDNSTTAILRAHVAQTSSRSLGYMTPEEIETRYDDDISELLDARRLLLEGTSAFSAVELLRVGLAEANMHAQYASRAGRPMLTYARERVAALTRSLDDFALLRRGGPWTSVEEVANLTLAERKALIRLFLDAADAALACGLLSLARFLLRQRSKVEADETQYWDDLVTRSRFSQNLEERVALMEEVARHLETSASDVPPHQKRRLQRRSAAAASYLSQSLARDGRETAAITWSYAASIWREFARGPAEPDGTRETDNSDAFEGFERILTSGGLGSVLEQALAEERPTAVIYALRKLASLPLDLNDAQVGSDSLTDLEDFVASRFEVPQNAQIDQAMRGERLLLIAIALARKFVPHQTCELFLELAGFATSSRRERLDWLELGADSALRAGRHVAHLNIRLYHLSLVLGSPENFDYRETATSADMLMSAIDVATGTVSDSDLLDILISVSGVVDKAVGLLADASVPPAFVVQLLERSGGQLERAFSLRPEILEGFSRWERLKGLEEAERALVAKTAYAEVIASPGAGSPRRLEDDALVSHGEGGDVYNRGYVVEGRKYGWIILPSNGEGGWVKHRLDIATDRVESLADRIWYELSPGRSGRPTPSLSLLGRMLPNGAIEALRSIQKCLLVCRGRFSRLPLHAARLPNGQFLIEQVAIGYRVAGGEASVRDVPADGAMVSGWETQTLAEREAKAVAHLIRTLGHDVAFPRDALAGRDALLRDDSVAILHVAGHGQSMRWPRSLQSYVQLRPGLVITAEDWLRGGIIARFVFMNSCSLGRLESYGGDLVGFPLALRARGAQGVVSATAEVAPESAERIAISFWKHAMVTADSLEAYVATLRSSINALAEPCEWAAYSFVGEPVEFSGTNTRLA